MMWFLALFFLLCALPSSCLAVFEPLGFPEAPYVAQLGASSDSRPVPDPTALTTAALTREVQSLKELILTRLDAMDKALILLQTRADRVPSEVDIKVGQLQALHGEKFRSVDNQFIASSTALAAALQAAKEAVDKGSQGTTKTIDQLAAVMGVETKSVNDKVTELRERLTKIEGRDSGIASSWGILTAVVGIIIGLVALYAANQKQQRHAT